MSGYYLSPELYDLVYADVVADVAPHVAAAKSAGGPVLEACCGTGRLLIPTLEAGVDADGLDMEPAMLARLREKLAAKRLKCGVHHGDMRDFTLPRRYALIAIGFNSFLHNLTQKDQLRTLLCCREHLEPHGRLQLVAFHPSAEKLIRWSNGEHLMKDLAIDGSTDRIRVYDSAVDDRVEQIRHMTRRIERVSAAGEALEKHRVTFSLRYVYKPEMELLLRVSGYKRWEVRPVFADYMDASSVTPAGAAPREGDILCWTAWKD